MAISSPPPPGTLGRGALLPRPGLPGAAPLRLRAPQPSPERPLSHLAPCPVQSSRRLPSPPTPALRTLIPETDSPDTPDLPGPPGVPAAPAVAPPHTHARPLPVPARLQLPAPPHAPGTSALATRRWPARPLTEAEEDEGTGLRAPPRSGCSSGTAWAGLWLWLRLSGEGSQSETRRRSFRARRCACPGRATFWEM